MNVKKTLYFSLLFFLFTFFLNAQYFNTSPLLQPLTSSGPEIGARAAVVIDAHTGTLLYSKNPNDEIPPASLTKLMTMHLIMKEINSGRATYNDIVPITVESWARNQPPSSSLMFLAPGQIVTLKEILLGLAVSSGNDAAVAAALQFAHSMGHFADMMTMEARSMGLNVTYFVEASGISEYNITTAEEFAYFCRQYVLQHPLALGMFHSVPEFSYPLAHNVAERYADNPRTIRQENRNSLLKTFRGVDGLKTGFIIESGYNIALTALRDRTRFIVVILGGESTRGREADGLALLSWAFQNFKTVRPNIQYTGNMDNPRLWKGKANSVDLELAHSPDFTSPANRAFSSLNYDLLYETYIPQRLIAPLAKGAFAGYLIISDDQGELNRVPLITRHEYKKGNIFKRIWHSIVLLFKKSE